MDGMESCYPFALNNWSHPFNGNDSEHFMIFSCDEVHVNVKSFVSVMDGSVLFFT